MGTTLTGQYFKMERRVDRHIDDIDVVDCSFDNCGLNQCLITNVRARNVRCWACHLNDLTIEECAVENLRATVTSGGGKRFPLTFQGSRFRHVALYGRVTGLMINKPWSWLTLKSWPADELEAFKNYYASIDWALDISAAEFTSVPSLRFVPGSLVRTNPSTQAVVRRERAAHVDLDAIDGIGVWRIVIDDLLRNPWPDETVLAAASASGKAAEDVEGIRRLRQAGVAD